MLTTETFIKQLGTGEPWEAFDIEEDKTLPKHLDVLRRNRMKAKLEKIAEILRCIEEGLHTSSKIAEETGYNQQYITDVLREQVQAGVVKTTELKKYGASTQYKYELV